MIKLPAFSEHRWLYLTALAVACVLAYAGIESWRGVAVDGHTVVRRDLVQTVVATGHIISPNRVDVGVQVTGMVKRIPVAQGQSVKAGELMIALEDAELLANDRQASLAVVQAEARLRQLREVQAPVAEQAVRQAQINLDNVQAAHKRNQQLLSQGFIGDAAMDDSRKAVELATSQLRAAEKQLETTRSSGSDYAVAHSALEQAQASAAAAHARATYALIKAPVAGVLIARNVEVGDVVQPGKLLMTLSPSGPVQVTLDIDEKNLKLIALGQKALVSADAFADKKFEAVLSYINPGVNLQTGAVETKLDIPLPPAYLRQDMTVSVDVEVARRAQALVVGSAAVADVDGAAPWVMRLENGRAVKAAVRVGLHSGGHVEILDGLREGDTVVANAASLSVGTRAYLRSTKP